MRIREIFLWLFLFGALALIWLAQEQLVSFHMRGYTTGAIRTPLLKNADILKPLTFGFENFTADILWLKAIQYVGGNLQEREFSGLFNYVNAVTDLDPKFSYPYHFAGLLLPNSGNLTEAEAILMKGERNLPSGWEPSYDLGFLYFYHLDTPEKAIAAYERCLEKSGCPSAAKRLIATLRAKEGKVEVAFFDLLSRFESASPEEIPFLRKKAEEIGKLLLLQNIAAVSPPKTNLSELVGMKLPDTADIRQLEGLLEEFTGRKLVSPQGAILEELLTNPFPDNPYAWEPETGSVRPQRW